MLQAVILIGGFGTRLQTVVSDVPKPMAPIEGRPFLEYQLSALRRGGITDVVLCAGYLAETVRAYFGDGARLGLRLVYSVEDKPLGTAGAVKFAAPLLRDTFFVLNGDTYLDLDYRAMKIAHRTHAAAATLAVRMSAETVSFGSIRMDAEGRIRAFNEKAAGAAVDGWINGGAYIFEHSILDSMPPDTAVSLEKETFPQLLAADAALYGFPTAGYFIDIGTPDTYRQFAQDIQKGIIHVNPQQSSPAH